jgi:hypothetical protein
MNNITPTHSSFLMRIACAVALSIPIAAPAAINKCVGPDGTVAFSDQPCNASHAATQLRAPAQPTARSNQNPAQVPSEGEATPNSEVNRYDLQCAEDRRLFSAAQEQVTDTIGKINLQLRKDRLDKRCNPEMRLAAFDRDLEGQAISCKVRREELDSMKKTPFRASSYGSRVAEIARGEAWLSANCPAPTR